MSPLGPIGRASGVNKGSYAFKLTLTKNMTHGAYIPSSSVEMKACRLGETLSDRS